MPDAPVSPVGEQRPGLPLTRSTTNIEPVELDGTAMTSEGIKAKDAKSRLGQVQLPPNPLSDITWNETDGATKQVRSTSHESRYRNE